MGTGRKYQKKPMTRPRKSGKARRRRHKVQRDRLLGLGVSEQSLTAMNQKQVREALRCPAKIA